MFYIIQNFQQLNYLCRYPAINDLNSNNLTIYQRHYYVNLWIYFLLKIYFYNYNHPNKYYHFSNYFYYH
jgi:hypothetical protein